MEVPADSIDCMVEVQDASVWWTTPNISAALGNNILRVEEGGNNHVLTIPDGLYSVASLSTTIERELVEASGISGLLTVTADDPTQKVNLNFAVALMQVDFNAADTPRDLLGFNAGDVPAILTTGEQHELGDNIAAFNMLDYYLIHSDIVRQGMRNDGRYYRTIAKVDVTEHPGSQILYQPFNPVRMDASNLIGSCIDKLTFWLTDQSNVPVETNGEDWSATVVVSYTRKFSV